MDSKSSWVPIQSNKKGYGKLMEITPDGIKRYSRTNYFCSNCYKTYTEVYDYKLGKIVEGEVPEKCIKCQWLTRIHVKVV